MEELDDDDDDGEPICRYCFEGVEAGELLSPCRCSGGQKFVHLSCLRRWQRMVLAGQPTHPAFYKQDARHTTCNICLAEFTCPPPTRHELMEAFTGPDLAAMIDIGCIIAADPAVSREMERELERLPLLERTLSNYEHWIRGTYLITAAEEDDGCLTLPVLREHTLDVLRNRLGDSMSVLMHGRRLRIVSAGSLAGVDQEQLPAALARLTAPATVCLAPEEPLNSGDDQITAVNITRPLAKAPKSSLVREAVKGACARYPGCDRVEVTHYSGGPCDPTNISCCIVPGGSSGWTVVRNLCDALELAHRNAMRDAEQKDPEFAGGQVRLKGLQGKNRLRLNGEVAFAVRFLAGVGRYLVRLRNGVAKQLRPANLEALGDAYGRVYAFWGEACWSRTQLLGEIARGHWGLCRASVADLATPAPQRWEALCSRLAFAPVTEMTESFLQEARSSTEAR
eukprot:gnl/TRDRNA2_/TRDRNA2_142201_c0_seq1.p1 gnl/TRDRNA2_/TRDRNA2_142201_c0~~gnl/TRDRNA2_/TRDRNA2_142201_c0_seq1.p1  ORF type:complete len:453 (+),score=73.61 gnl/TRDRNA2_/TRDRNA2_142201_c0_seq1:38-1396(+)